MEAGRLGQILIRSKALQESQLAVALAEQRRVGGKLGEILVRLRFVTEAQVTEALATQLHLATVSLDPLPEIAPSTLQRIPAATARLFGVVPVEYREDDRTLVVATAEPLKAARLEELREHAHCWIVPKLAARTSLIRAIELLYGPATVTGGAPAEPARRGARRTPETQQAMPELSHLQLSALVRLLVEKGVLSPADVTRLLQHP